MKNRKTTFAGVAAILAGLAGVVTCLQAETISYECLGTAASGVIAGIGLLFSKDHNVTGGTLRQ